MIYIYICFHHTELTQITPIIEQKKAKNTNYNNNSQRNHDDKRPRMTSNDLKRTSNEPVKKRNKLKSGAVIEINEHYLDKILHNNIS